MKQKIILSIFAVAITFIMYSCAPSTPASRIAQNPVMFENLSSSDKELAQLGQIKRGMHRDGVLIAWGKPRGLNVGSRNGKSYEKWIYTASTPVYTNSFHHYNGLAYRRFGRHDCLGYYNGLTFGPEVYYIQQTAATVEFDQNNKVTDWVRRR